MPKGIVPKSNDDKDWKMAVERTLEELLRAADTLQRQLNELSRRK